MPTTQDIYPVSFTADTAQFIADMLDWNPEMGLQWIATLEDIVRLPEALGTWS